MIEMILSYSKLIQVKFVVSLKIVLVPENLTECLDNASDSDISSVSRLIWSPRMSWCTQES